MLPTPETTINFIQPVSDDYSTDGYLKEFARIDHQHPLSNSLRRAIFNSTVYVKRTGDSMSGNLLMSGTSQVQFNNGNNYIAYHANLSGIPWMSGPRIIGNDGFSFYNVNQSIDVLGYRGTSTLHYMWISNQLLVGSSPSDALATQVLNVNGHVSMLNSGQIIWTNWSGGTIWMADATWVRISPNTYCAGTAGAASLSVAAGGALGGYNAFFNSTVGMASTLAVSGTIISSSTIQGLITTGKQTGGLWNNSAIQAIPFAGNAQITFHTGSNAPIHGAVNGLGENQYFRNSNFAAGTSNCYSAAWGIDSSRRFKKNINDWPMKSAGAAVQPVTQLIAKLRTVSFHPKAIDPDLGGERRSMAWIRLNKIREKQGREPYEMPHHDCSIHNCTGTADDPCVRKLNWDRPRLGFIAEEVQEIFPEATPLDKDKLPEAVELGNMMAIVVAGLQEIIERVNALEGAAA